VNTAQQNRRRGLVHNHPDHAERTILINPCFEVDVAKQMSRPLILAMQDLRLRLELIPATKHFFNGLLGPYANA
jgi:hypothetical protein